MIKCRFRHCIRGALHHRRRYLASSRRAAGGRLLPPRLFLVDKGGPRGRRFLPAAGAGADGSGGGGGHDWWQWGANQAERGPVRLVHGRLCRGCGSAAIVIPAGSHVMFFEMISFKMKPIGFFLVTISCDHSTSTASLPRNILPAHRTQIQIDLSAQTHTHQRVLRPPAASSRRPPSAQALPGPVERAVVAAGHQVTDLIYPQFEVIRAIMLDDSPHVAASRSRKLDHPCLRHPELKLNMPP